MIQPAVARNSAGQRGLILWHLHSTFKGADKPLNCVGAYLATLCAHVATVCHSLSHIPHGVPRAANGRVPRAARVPPSGARHPSGARSSVARVPRAVRVPRVWHAFLECGTRSSSGARSPASWQTAAEAAEVFVFPAEHVAPFWETTCCFRRSIYPPCHPVHVAGRVHGATLNRLSHGVAKSLYKDGLSAPLQMGLPNLGRTCYLGVAALTSTPTPTH